MAPLRSLGNINSAFDDFYARTGNDVSPLPPPDPISASGGFVDGAEPGNGYTYHVFTTSGALTVSSGNGNVEILLVAGGGGGGGTSSSGGGGAGGLRNITGIPVTPGPYSITVGDGGTCPGPSAGRGQQGGPSTAFGYTSIGGGGGGNSPGYVNGGDGGSGGGGDGGGTGGAGNTPPSSPSQGNPGGDAGSNGGGGGGGHAQAGSNGIDTDPTATGGPGGDGSPFPAYASPLFPTMPSSWKNAVGSSGYYAGGGGGGSQNLPGNPAPSGGQGGGGKGDTGPGNGSAGVDNTGGGGGGAGRGVGFDSNGFDGGNGIVIVRYQT